MIDFDKLKNFLTLNFKTTINYKLKQSPLT